MRRLASLLALAAILGAALGWAAPAFAEQPEQKVGSFVAMAHIDIWKHSDGTWQKGLYNGKENVTEDAAYDPKALGINTAGYKLTRVALTYPFGEAEYDAAGKRYGLSWKKFEKYYEHRALIHEVKLKSFDAATGRTVVEWRFDLKPYEEWNKPWVLTDPTVREELRITPPPGFADAVEGYRYELPVIITWYGIPYPKPPDFSVALDRDEYRGDPGNHVTVKATFRLNKEHPRRETAKLSAYHVVGGKEYPAALKPVDPADALRPDGTADFDPGEAKTYTFQVAVQPEATRVVVKINPWSASDDADWSNNRDEALVAPNLPPDFSVALDKDEYLGDPGGKVTVKAVFRLNKDHPVRETARLSAWHVVGGKEYPVSLKPVDPADALRPDGTVEFNPGEAKAYTFQVAVQSEATKVVAKINPWSKPVDADWSNNRDEAPVVPNLVDVAVKISPIKSPVWVWWKSETGTARAGANTTVMRLDNLPVEVEVRAAISGPAGRDEYRVRLGPGRRYNKPYFFTAGPGTYAVTVEAWPVGMKDADPSNNKASTQIRILKQQPPETGPKEPGLHAEIISR